MEATTTTLVVSGKKRKLNDCTQYHQPKYDLLSPEYEYLGNYHFNP
jgi:hypothetical protein